MAQRQNATVLGTPAFGVQFEIFLTGRIVCFSHLPDRHSRLARGSIYQTGTWLEFSVVGLLVFKSQIEPDLAGSAYDAGICNCCF